MDELEFWKNEAEHQRERANDYAMQALAHWQRLKEAREVLAFYAARNWEADPGTRARALLGDGAE